MQAQSFKTVTLRDGRDVPVLGMGGWTLGDASERRSEEIRTLQAGIERGLRVIDTAEMYGNGRSETLIGEAIAGRRDQVFLVSKVLPHHASAHDVQMACRASLQRLRTDCLDLYLLHWRGAVPLGETVAGMEKLKKEGLIRSWGVSNFDTQDMEELARESGDCAANQILYNLDHRGVEFDLLERDARHGVVTMAYSPLGQGGALLRHPALLKMAEQHAGLAGPVTPAQLALAWVLRREPIIAIPKTASHTHLLENIEATRIKFSEEDLLYLDKYFDPPNYKKPLEMI